MEYVYCFFLFFFGASVGSFVNVVVLRYKTGLSPFKGSSGCFSCGKELRFYELIPVFSFLFLRGRCRSCGSKLSLQYLLVEIISGLAFVWTYYNLPRLSDGQEFLIFYFVILVLIFETLMAIFVYDLRHKIIPDSFLIIFVILSLFFLFLNHKSIFLNLAAAVAVPLPFFLIWLFSSGRLIGFGDVKFMAVMGILLGFKVGLSSIFISFWVGLAYVVARLLFNYISGITSLRIGAKRLTMKSELPFAPFLVIGTLLGLFLQINLINF